MLIFATLSDTNLGADPTPPLLSHGDKIWANVFLHITLRLKKYWDKITIIQALHSTGHAASTTYMLKIFPMHQVTCKNHYSTATIPPISLAKNIYVSVCRLFSNFMGTFDVHGYFSMKIFMGIVRKFTATSFPRASFLLFTGMRIFISTSAKVTEKIT